MPKYCNRERLPKPPKTTSPTITELRVNNESIVAELTAIPNFDVTNPKVIKTSGDITIKINNQIVNLFSLLAQTVLTELAASATRTAIIIKNQI